MSELCPHRWMHGVMTCPRCGFKEQPDDTDALRHELNDWRQFGFAHVGPPITCDQDMREGIEENFRKLRAELAEAKRGLAAWEGLAEWGKDPRGKRGWVPPVFFVVKDAWGTAARNDMSGDRDIEAFGPTATAAAIDLAVKLGVLEADTKGSE
jgi:hypothetical protein